MEQIVRVHRLRDDGRADIILVRESACSGDCHKCSGCGAQKETMIVTADNPIRAEVGDFVTLTSDTASVMKAVVAVYLVPLVMFFAGFALGMTLGWGGPLVGGLGFLLGLAFAVWFDRRTAKKGETVYTITGYAPGQGHG
jgi:sigma-E factor negative regulatory protein RseC